MAVINNKFVHQDGSNAPTDLVNGYQVADSASEQLAGMRGDLLFAKDINRLYLHQGNHHSYIYHTEDPPPATVIPPTLPPSPLSVKYMQDAYWNMTDADDAICIYAASFACVVTMHNATTAKVKPYHIKAWAGFNIHIRTISGNYMEAPALTEIIIAPPATLTLVPLTGHPYWMIV